MANTLDPIHKTFWKPLYTAEEQQHAGHCKHSPGPGTKHNLTCDLSKYLPKIVLPGLDSAALNKPRAAAQAC